jgi:hypothetical protein
MLGSGMPTVVHYGVWTVTYHPGTWHDFKVCVRATVKLCLKVTVDLVVHHLSDNRTVRGQVVLAKQLSRLDWTELALLLCSSNEWDRLEDVISDLSCPTLGLHQLLEAERRLKPVGDRFWGVGGGVHGGELRSYKLKLTLKASYDVPVSETRREPADQTILCY